MESFPAPKKRIKTLRRSIEKSVLAACAMDQNPFSINMGILVVIIAVNMIVSRGIAANRTDNPMSIRIPQAISNVATKDDRNSGLAKPIASKRPVPFISGNRNFCIPSERNTRPTISLGRTDL